MQCYTCKPHNNLSPATILMHNLDMGTQKAEMTARLTRTLNNLLQDSYTIH